VTRVGGIKPFQIDVRFIVATNQDLEARATEGTFRHDLYHRLNVVKIHMPPLRERTDDIPLLVQHFVDQFNQQYHRQVKGFDAASMKKLMAHSWPGNIRELQNLVERHIALADGDLMTIGKLSEMKPSSLTGEGIDADLPTLSELERRYILKLLDLFNGNRETIAETLNINKSTLWRKLQSYRQADSE